MLMKIYNLPRGSGKTTRLLYISDYNKIPILCANINSKNLIRQMAYKQGLNIPEPICVSDLEKGKNLPYKEVLVDEAFEVLRCLISHIQKGDVKIGAVTFTEVDNIDKKVNEFG